MMKRKIILISAIMIFLTCPCVFAQKSQEKDDLSLFEIDRLIRRTEYDEALRQLNIYIEKNPEKFDNAQSRIKRIMHARNQYSILAERLIKLIQTDPGNNKEIYEITAQLEKFEKHPSDQNLQFIADLKKSAEFNYFRALFLEIQNETAARSQAGEYVAAVEKAKEGFIKITFMISGKIILRLPLPLIKLLQASTRELPSLKKRTIFFALTMWLMIL